MNRLLSWLACWGWACLMVGCGSSDGLNLQGADNPTAQGKSLSAWVKQLQDGDVAQRCDALMAMRELGEKADPAATVIAKAVQDPDPFVAPLAADVLIGLGHKTRLPAKKLALLLKVDNEMLRIWAGNF